MNHLVSFARRSHSRLPLNLLTRCSSSFSEMDSAAPVALDPKTSSQDIFSATIRQVKRSSSSADPRLSQRYTYGHHLNAFTWRYHRGGKCFGSCPQTDEKDNVMKTSGVDVDEKTGYEKNVDADTSSSTKKNSPVVVDEKTEEEKTNPVDADPSSSTKKNSVDVDETTGDEKNVDETTGDEKNVDADPSSSTKKNSPVVVVEKTEVEKTKNTPLESDPQSVKKFIVAINVEIFLMWIGKYPRIGNCFPHLVNLYHLLVYKLIYYATLGKVVSTRRPLYHNNEAAAVEIARIVSPVVVGLITWRLLTVFSDASEINNAANHEILVQGTLDLAATVRQLLEEIKQMKSRTTAVELEVLTINRAFSSPFEFIKYVLGF